MSMIKNVLITGDTHSRVEGRLAHIKETMPEYLPEETAVIIMGDAGLNYYLSKHDWKLKHYASKFGYTIYCLRGNHEQRPSEIGKKMKFIYDEFVHGFVWMEDEFPLIKYFDDEVAKYEIMGKKVLCIPGAYSVDKWYRLQNNWCWFPKEQLSAEEMADAEKEFANEEFDLVFSHTCPMSWEPNDLFLRGIDQSKVDKTMEVWMDKFKDTFNWKMWLFGHYHADRLERPYVEQFYEEVEDLNSVIARWEKYDKTGELDWWLPKARDFYQGIEGEVK